MKYCNRCETNLPLSSFSPNKAKSDGLQGYCRPCMKEYRREHYQANKQPYLDRAVSQKQRLLDLAAALKDVPCTDCGNRYPSYAMDFDHLDGEAKINSIANLTKLGSEAKLLLEVAKCEVVCAVCHRIRTHNRHRIVV